MMENQGTKPRFEPQNQGNEPQKIKLTELEKSECIKATQAVEGTWVGVDFISLTTGMYE